MKPRFDVMVAGDMFVDMVMSGNVRPQFHQVEQIVERYAVQLGGSANIFATQICRLGARTGVTGVIGDDQFGRLAVDRLRSLDVDVAAIRTVAGGSTGLSVALAEPDDRAILTVLGVGADVGPKDLPPRPEEACRHWHVASFFLLSKLRTTWRSWLEKCQLAGVTTSFDPNWDPEDRWEGVKDLLPFIDVFLPNEAEARRLTGLDDPVEAARALCVGDNLVVVKMGPQGACAVKGGRTWTIKPEPADPATIADTVGAGDNFDAGFIRAWMLGKDMDACLELGHRCGLSSLRCTGGIEGQLNERVGTAAPAQPK